MQMSVESPLPEYFDHWVVVCTQEPHINQVFRMPSALDMPKWVCESTALAWVRNFPNDIVMLVSRDD